MREFHPEVLNDHLYVIIPLLLKICANGISEKEFQLNIEILRTIDVLKNCFNFSEHIGHIVHSCLHIMEN